MDIKFYRAMKGVDRLNGKFKHRTYNLLEHSYMVAMLFRHFASKEDVAYDINVLDIILHHDIVEVATSDLSYVVKNHSEVTKKAWGDIEEDVLSSPLFSQLSRYSDKKIKSGLSALQHDLFKVCDLLDLWIFLKEEKAYGNNSWDVNDILDRCVQLIKGKFRTVDKFMESYHV
jgi:5'-deoxynucleotidase YfbR-like HD superfamily hydrolase